MGRKPVRPLGDSRSLWTTRRKRRSLVIVAIAVAASVVTVAWVVDRSERGVTLTVDTDHEDYAQGDPVTINAQITNHGFRTVNLVYPSSLIVQLSVYDSGGLRVFVEPTAACDVITPIVLEPGGTWEREYVWHQVNCTDDQVELPDSFTVSAFSWSYEHQFSAEVTISISD
ncbi:MAG: hypothetical protein MUO87_08460 [Thermoplasmata archaeon]|nr:hypothetical protein [Thermoplasmata archaeon]